MVDKLHGVGSNNYEAQPDTTKTNKQPEPEQQDSSKSKFPPLIDMIWKMYDETGGDLKELNKRLDRDTVIVDDKGTSIFIEVVKRQGE